MMPPFHNLSTSNVQPDPNGAGNSDVTKKRKAFAHNMWAKKIASRRYSSSLNMGNSLILSRLSCWEISSDNDLDIYQQFVSNFLFTPVYCITPQQLLLTLYDNFSE
jgi:hypothetical protein